MSIIRAADEHHQRRMSIIGAQVPRKPPQAPRKFLQALRKPPTGPPSLSRKSGPLSYIHVSKLRYVMV